MMTKAIADYFKTQPVLKAWLFGSFARGEETPKILIYERELETKAGWKNGLKMFLYISQYS